jgi:hypothetical protein
MARECCADDGFNIALEDAETAYQSFSTHFLVLLYDTYEARSYRYTMMNDYLSFLLPSLCTFSAMPTTHVNNNDCDTIPHVNSPRKAKSKSLPLQLNPRPCTRSRQNLLPTLATSLTPQSSHDVIRPNLTTKTTCIQKMSVPRHSAEFLPLPNLLFLFITTFEARYPQLSPLHNASWQKQPWNFSRPALHFPK